MRITAVSDVGSVSTLEDLRRYSSLFMGQAKDAINGGIAIENMKASVRSAVFAGASLQIQVPHGVGSVPVGYIKIAGPDIIVFDGINDNTADNIYVRATGAGTVTLLILG